MLLAGSANSDWYLGLTLGFIIVVVVVIVVAMITTYASRISDQVRLATQGLEEVRDGTAPLWEVRKTNTAGVAILEAARTARGAVVATVTGTPAATPDPPPSVREPIQPPVVAREPTPAPSVGRPSAPVAEPPGVLGPDSYPHRGRGA